MDAEENSVVRLDRGTEQQTFRDRIHFATEVGAIPAHTKVLMRSTPS
jgi:hypothetical protein